MVFGAVAVILLLLCAGVTGAYLFKNRSETATTDPASQRSTVAAPAAPPVEEAPAVAAEEAPAEPAPPQEEPVRTPPAPKAAPIAREAQAAPAKAPPAPKAAAAPAPPSPPPAGPFSVRFNVPGMEGTVECGNGQQAEFVGSTTLIFQGVEGVVTCIVKSRKDKKKGAVQVDRGGTVTCTESDLGLSCER